VRKDLLIFAGGIVVGVGVMAFWSVFSTRPSAPGAISRPTRSEWRPTRRHSSTSDAAQVREPPVRRAAVPSDNPTQVTETAPPPNNAFTETSPTPPIAVPYLDSRLQKALRSYRAASDNIDRSLLASEVGKLADAAVPKPQIAVALGTMLGEEDSVDVKTDILDELGDLDDPAAFDQIVQGLGRTQPQEVRLEAIDALQVLGDQRAIPVLKQLLSDHDADVREAAQDGIDFLSDY
jgi:HEAT repeats